VLQDYKKVKVKMKEQSVLSCNLRNHKARNPDYHNPNVDRRDKLTSQHRFVWSAVFHHIIFCNTGH
jgi:hypothetical protein